MSDTPRRQTKKKGLVIVNTGDGKGKSTADRTDNDSEPCLL